MDRLAAALLIVAACDASAPAPPTGTVPVAARASAPAASATAAATAAPAASATASPSATAAVPPGMVRVPAGIFLMGADAARGNPEEKPAHEAIVAGFLMDAKEVTLAAYKECVAGGGCTKPQPLGRFCNTKLEGRDQHPVNCVDLVQAAAYCRWAGKRLPTEREWEYAASGGSERRRFSWGDDDPDAKRACYYHAYGSCEVGSFAPGAFGLYDITGNVWEWTQSEFTPYPSRFEPDPIVPRRQYVYRGGSWSRRFPKWMRNMLRNRYQPDQHSAAIGMRCVQRIEPLECPADTSAKGGECVRVRGQVLCEAGRRWSAERNKCLLDLEAAVAPAVAPGSQPVGSATPGPAASIDPATPPVVTRARTPRYDEDCKRHWPGTPASYLFTGGPNFPSRKPALAAAGCRPRDMGWSWTSACCP